MAPPKVTLLPTTSGTYRLGLENPPIDDSSIDQTFVLSDAMSWCSDLSVGLERVTDPRDSRVAPCCDELQGGRLR